jgi:hypothetical protein
MIGRQADLHAMDEVTLSLLACEAHDPAKRCGDGFVRS